MIDINRIYLGDCLDIMKYIPDKSIDLVLTDPPYGIGEDGKKNHSRGCLAKTTKFTDKKWDNEIPSRQIFDEIFRISKNAIIFGGNYFVDYLANSPCWLVWDKDNGKTDFADCELAWTNFKSAVRKYTFKWQGMLQQDMKNKEIRLHPTQKPVDLFGQIIRDYSRENDLILDCFSGSGTTALACSKLKRNFICIEKDPDYYKMSVKRLEEHKRQGVLF